MTWLMLAAIGAAISAAGVSFAAWLLPSWSELREELTQYALVLLSAAGCFAALSAWIA